MKHRHQGRVLGRERNQRNALIKTLLGSLVLHERMMTTEAKAKEAGYAVKAGTFPFIGNGKAIALGEAEGFIKTVFDAKTGELLGAHMIGAEVTELIQGYVVGKTLETTEAELMTTALRPDADPTEP